MKKISVTLISIIFIITTMLSTGVVQAFAKDISYTNEDGEVLTEIFYDGKISKPELKKYSENYAKIDWEFENYTSTMGFEILLDEGSKGNFEHYAYILKPQTNDEYKYEYKLKNLKPGTTYAVKIRFFQDEFGNRYFGSTSKALVFATSPEITQLKSVKYLKKGKVKVKWKKSKGATGYIIQCSSKKNFDSMYTDNCFVEKVTNNATVGGLTKGKYYVRVIPFRIAEKYKAYTGGASKAKSVKVKKGLSLKQVINYQETDLSGRKDIKEITNNGVDIKKYKTTYNRLKAIYGWHAKHYNDFKSCMECNMSFNSCVDSLFGNCRKYDAFIYLAAGDVKNSSSSKTEHMWSVLFFSGKPYIFDPRLQGYTGNYKGSTYFGAPYGSKTAGKYIFKDWVCRWR